MSALSLLLPAALALLSGCQREPAASAPAGNTAAGTSAAATATPAPTRAQRLQTFLQTRYGAAAVLKGGWTDAAHKAADGTADPLERKVCAEQPVVIGEAVHQLLAVCGSRDGAGHPEPGSIDFFVLREDGAGYTVAAERLDDSFGSMGRPGTVSVLRLGRDLYGFRVEHGWYGQGYALVSQDLILPGPKGLAPAGSLRRHIDNEGALDCEAEDVRCENTGFNMEFALHVDDSDPNAATWPLLVVEAGRDCVVPAVREHRFTLDPKTRTYPFTETLQREGCGIAVN